MRLPILLKGELVIKILYLAVSPFNKIEPTPHKTPINHITLILISSFLLKLVTI